MDLGWSWVNIDRGNQSLTRKEMPWPFADFSEMLVSSNNIVWRVWDRFYFRRSLGQIFELSFFRWVVPPATRASIYWISIIYNLNSPTMSSIAHVATKAKPSVANPNASARHLSLSPGRLQKTQHSHRWDFILSSPPSDMIAVASSTTFAEFSRGLPVNEVLPRICNSQLSIILGGSMFFQGI